MGEAESLTPEDRALTVIDRVFSDAVGTVLHEAIATAIREAEERGRREERRACAEVAREQLLDGPGNAGEAIAKAIEARGGEG